VGFFLLLPNKLLFKTGNSLNATAFSAELTLTLNKQQKKN
jgi:hypothetical protein